MHLIKLFRCSRIIAICQTQIYSNVMKSNHTETAPNAGQMESFLINHDYTFILEMKIGITRIFLFYFFLVITITSVLSTRVMRFLSKYETFNEARHSQGDQNHQQHV